MREKRDGTAGCPPDPMGGPWLRAQDRSSNFINSTSYSKASLVLAGICLAALVTAWSLGVHRIHTARKSHKAW